MRIWPAHPGYSRQSAPQRDALPQPVRPQRAVVARGDNWLDLRGKSFVVLGATSALGPLATLLACGATVLAVARPRAARARAGEPDSPAASAPGPCGP